MSKPDSWSLLKNHSLLLVFILGFTSGLPLSLSITTLQAWFTVSNIPVVAIGWLTLLGMPYTYKFIWAPLLERYPLSWLGPRRGWIVVTQITLLCEIAALSCLDPQQNPGLICLLALLISFVSATHDSVVDAYRTDILKVHDAGKGSALFVMGYRIAMLVSGGLSLVVASQVGWHITFIFIAILMLPGIIATVLAPDYTAAKINKIQEKSILRSLIIPLLDFWKRPHSLAIFGFIVIYKTGEAFSVSLGSNFLIHGVGFSLIDVGAIYKTVGLVATLGGAYAGGVILNYINLYRSLFFFGILQGLALLLFAALAMVGKNYSLLFTAVFAENFSAGMATCALMVFIMRLCNQKYTVAQYSLFAAFSAAGRVFVGPFAGFMAEYCGWVTFFYAGFIMTLPGLLLLYYLRDKPVEALGSLS